MCYARIILAKVFGKNLLADLHVHLLVLFVSQDLKQVHGQGGGRVHGDVEGDWRPQLFLNLNHPVRPETSIACCCSYVQVWSHSLKAADRYREMKSVLSLCVYHIRSSAWRLTAGLKAGPLWGR